MAKISFENIVGDGDNYPPQNPYRGLDWDNFTVIDDDLLKDTVGNRHAIRTGEAAAFNDFKQPASFKSPDQTDNFDLNSGHFTAFNANDLTVKVFGFDDGERVAKQVLTLDPEREFVKFGAQFDDIDEVKFTPSGGTDPNPDDGQPLTHVFAVDDLFIDF